LPAAPPVSLSDVRQLDDEARRVAAEFTRMLSARVSARSA